MNYLVGIILALAACGVGRAFRLDRDGAFYPTVLIVVATYYVLFAVMGSDQKGLLIESVIAAGFAVVAVSGFRHSLWLVVAALFAHGVLDFYHQALIDNPGVPPFWPGFCLAFDVTAAMVLAGLLRSAQRHK